VALLKAALALASSAPGAANPPSTSSTVTNPDMKPTLMANFGQDLGVFIIRRALTRPTRTILSNADEEAGVIVGTLSSQYGTPDKFDASNARL
jgi:chaperonin GroEL